MTIFNRIKEKDELTPDNKSPGTMVDRVKQRLTHVFVGRRVPGMDRARWTRIYTLLGQEYMSTSILSVLDITTPIFKFSSEF